MPRNADAPLLIGNVPAAAAFTNQTPLLAVTIAQSLIAGSRRRRVSSRATIRILRPAQTPAFRWFAVAVPMTYIGVYLLGTLFGDGIWWDWNVALGSWIWSGVCGFALSLLIVARRTA